MSVWIKCEEKMPPLNEPVLILYKDKSDESIQDNLFYGIASWIKDSSFGFERWTYFTENSSHYEVVYWTMPRIEGSKSE